MFFKVERSLFSNWNKEKFLSVWKLFSCFRLNNSAFRQCSFQSQILAMGQVKGVVTSDFAIGQSFYGMFPGIKANGILTTKAIIEMSISNKIVF